MNDLQDLERIVDACVRIDIAPVGLNISLVLLARLLLHAWHAEAAGPCSGGREDGPAATAGFADYSKRHGPRVYGSR
jgi:hypothetical protein